MNNHTIFRGMATIFLKEFHIILFLHVFLIYCSECQDNKLYCLRLHTVERSKTNKTKSFRQNFCSLFYVWRNKRISCVKETEENKGYKSSFLSVHVNQAYTCRMTQDRLFDSYNCDKSFPFLILFRNKGKLAIPMLFNQVKSIIPI